MRYELTEVPSEEKVMNGAGKFRNGKAGGESGILPEMVNAACCEEEFVKTFLDLVNDVWERGCTPCASPTVTTGGASHCWTWWRRL